MGTDVNPVAWENAEITAYALIRNPNSKNLLDYYLEFGSYLDKNMVNSLLVAEKNRYLG